MQTISCDKPTPFRGIPIPTAGAATGKLRGSTLVLSVIALAVALTFSSVAWHLTSNTSQLEYRSRKYSEAYALAEGVHEIVLSGFVNVSTASIALTGPATAAELQTTLPNPSTFHSYLTSAGVNAATLSSQPQLRRIELVALNSSGKVKSNASARPDKVVGPKPGNPTVSVPQYRYGVVAGVAMRMPQGPEMLVTIIRHAVVVLQPITDYTIANFASDVVKNSSNQDVWRQGSIALHPGDSMVVGKIHANQDLFATTRQSTTSYSNQKFLQFIDTVTYGRLFREGLPWYLQDVLASNKKRQFLDIQAPKWKDAKHYYPQGSNKYVPTEDLRVSMGGSATADSQLSASPALTPLGIDPTIEFNKGDANPNNDGFREIIEPKDPNYSESDKIKDIRIANKASLVIKIVQPDAASPVQVTVTNQDGQPVPSGVQQAVIDSMKDATGNVVRKDVYDPRETMDVKVTEIDVKKLGDAIALYGSAYNGVVYAYDDSPQAFVKTVGSGASAKNLYEQRAIRLANAHALPSSGSADPKGFTFATKNAVYVKGDYNTTDRTDTAYTPTSLPANQGNPPSASAANVKAGKNKVPAAVLADNITVLSNGWDDANDDAQLQYKAAANTTVNVAFVTGSTFLHKQIADTDVNPQGLFPDGGGHNLIRLAENWDGKTARFSGAQVVLYRQNEFTGAWSDSHYSAPIRYSDWDSELANKQPPAIPSIPTFHRGRWQLVSSPDATKAITELF